MAAISKITSPDDPALAALCVQLREMSAELDRGGNWPAEQLRLCGQYGVYEWFLDPSWGGQGWNEEQIVRGYLALSAACLTTTFIITQRTGACRRIAGCDNDKLKQRLLPGLASGELFATVGISHLTTSRRHLAKPVLSAEATASGFRLDGMSPWVTGGAAADALVLAATQIENGQPTDRQLLICVPRGLPGLSVPDPLPLIGVSASSTGPVHLDGVEVSSDWLIAGPMPNVMASGIGASTGGHETSTLAIGLAHAAIDYLASEASRRTDLQAATSALRAEHSRLLNDLVGVARGDSTCSKESLRQRANSLVLRASQAALAAAKGSGYVVGHPAGRWCREALFFLVWSCPQPVAAANLCELAGIDD
ncbi:MAG TPA: acyl-CoA dehydrogenase family protein [Lacipirellulaceae bacterium]|nr:acyl-CoA dehydrogenase family protein [Lacipirellulaceae bacterium]